jgi:hypothetical protein
MKQSVTMLKKSNHFGQWIDRWISSSFKFGSVVLAPGKTVTAKGFDHKLFIQILMLFSYLFLRH